MLLYDISSKNQIASDRFYRALYSKLPIPAVMHSSKVILDSFQSSWFIVILFYNQQSVLSDNFYRGNTEQLPKKC